MIENKGQKRHKNKGVSAKPNDNITSGEYKYFFAPHQSELLPQLIPLLKQMTLLRRHHVVSPYRELRKK